MQIHNSRSTRQTQKTGATTTTTTTTTTEAAILLATSRFLLVRIKSVKEIAVEKKTNRQRNKQTRTQDSVIGNYSTEIQLIDKMLSGAKYKPRTLRYGGILGRQY